MVDDQLKAEIIESCKGWMGQHYIGPRPQAACLHWAAILTLECRRAGVNAIPQAGSAQFSRLAEDPMEMFSYIFENPEAQARKVMLGLMPEVHCWVATKDQEIMDLTVGMQKQQCLETTGEAYTQDHPEYIWQLGSTIWDEHTISYACDRMATYLFYVMLQNPTTIGELVTEDGWWHLANGLHRDLPEAREVWT